MPGEIISESLGEFIGIRKMARIAFAILRGKTNYREIPA
jgi:hypothetical protein